MRNKISATNYLGVPCPKGEIIPVTDACAVWRAGALSKWQELNSADLSHCQSHTSGLDSHGTLRHDYPANEWRLVPHGHWNWKWNQARSDYSTYDQELLAGMLMLSCQSRLLHTNPVVWLCDQQPVKTFQKGPNREKAKLKLGWTYNSQFSLTVPHIQGIQNETVDYISCNSINALLGESSEALAKKAFLRMDLQLDLSMRTAGVLEGWSLKDYQSEYQFVLDSLSDGLGDRLIDGDRWYKDNQYLYYEDRIAVPESQMEGCLQWSNLSSRHSGCNRSVEFFRERFYSRLICVEVRACMQPIVVSCGSHASKQSDSRDQGPVPSLPIFYCDNSLLYRDFIHGLPQFGGYDSCLIVICRHSPAPTI